MKDHWITTRDDYGMAWIKLLLSASFEVRSVLVRDALIELKPGQLIGSERYFAEQWSWTRDKVRSFLALLEQDTMITRHLNHKTTIISICNWSKYQVINPDDNQRATTKPPNAPPQDNRRPYQIKQDNNLNNSTTNKKDLCVVCPIWNGCEFFRMSQEDFARVAAWYQNNNLPQALIAFAIREVDRWLGSDSPKAKAQQKKTTSHSKQLYAGWVIENAQKLARATGKGAPVGKLTNVEKAVKELERIRNENNLIEVNNDDRRYRQIGS